MSHDEIPENEQPVDLSVDAEAFSAPGDGASAEADDANNPQMGPTTYGTTCWGTPCPSANTYSC
jgi:hypothetical protein